MRLSASANTIECSKISSNKLYIFVTSCTHYTNKRSLNQEVNRI
ncbi:hypothetical protein [Listeria phage vB_Lmo_3274]